MIAIAKKSFGQNFLIDDRITERIVSELFGRSDQHFLEIGAGLGALTKVLLKHKFDVTAIELDHDLLPTLKGIQQHFSLLNIISGDALKFDFTQQGAHYWRVIGNLPYNISSALLLHCFDSIDALVDMHFMLQNEVVDRLVADPGCKDYGRLSVITQYYCNVEKLFEVPKESFNPIPKVLSAVVRLTPKQERINVSVDQLAKVTQYAFGQRRKTLRNSLSALFTHEQLVALEIDPMRRAETLSLEEFCRLAQNIYKHT